MDHVETSQLERNLASRHVALRVPYSLDDSDILARQRARESNARSYPRRLPLVLRRGAGIYVEDTSERVFIDCLSAAGTLVLGHNHPVVVEAIRHALRDGLPMQTLDLSTPVKDAFVDELFGLLPTELARDARIQFCGPTGTDAVEAALKLVKTATGRGTVLAFHGAYHGMSLGSLGLMGNLEPKKAISGVGQGTQFLPYPYGYRCPFGIGGPAGERAGLQYIRNMLEDPESGVLPPAGMILEAVQGEGGVIPAPDEWLQGLRRLATDSGVPLILDEVQTGFGRTGRIFAFEHSGIVPDVVVLSKALGGGLPLSVVVYKGSLDRWQPGAHAGTFRGNQLGMATGLATMRFIRKEGLHQHAEAMGRRLRNHLLELQRQYPQIGEVRGRGLMLGMELVEQRAGEQPPEGPLGSPRGDRRFASAVQRAAVERGLILELGGRHGGVVRLLPPLIVTESQIDHIAAILAAAFSAAAAASAS
jgi:diaminobutyrate-2-oxoglutarate transaminase